MRAPGGINDIASLWDTLIERKSHHACLSTDPRFLRRFNPKDFDAMFSVTPDARKTLHGNLLDETPGLDESYFGVSKRDSASMDAQQKLLLHVAHEALEDAGFSGVADGSPLDPSSFGVYIGSATDDFFKVALPLSLYQAIYAKDARQDPNSYPIDIYHLVRNQRAFLAGQISHHFGLHGPSVAVDTVVLVR
ncbi:beta-ketoacyl synthase [Infundibulicybe gibba]|nr:beta-ketoacyl synthase [Infundibulicybe gibba]